MASGPTHERFPSDPSAQTPQEPIAIIGLSCRFPNSESPEAFWNLLANGGDAIREVPPDHFDVDQFYDPRPGVPGKIVSRWGGFLHDVDHFAAGFFGISPREARRMDPQQRLLLEVAWEAIEDAGLVAANLEGTNCGVFVGNCYTDYEDLMLDDPQSMDVYSIVGGQRHGLPGRISYILGLQGPSISTDTACSSSLVALHLACQSLRCGESDLALAAGVNLVLEPEFSIGFSSAGMLSPEGRCKFGDASANGFVRSDGVGVVVLSPLSRAQAAGYPIHAVIRGSAVNNDGRSSGYMMTPGEGGQEQVIRQAYQVAGIDPREVDYVEAHGTGTHAGDPVELKALARVLGEKRPTDRPLLVGSVKTNIGHTEGAAGIAGLLKVVLALRHDCIPPSLHLHDPSPAIPWNELPLAIPQRPHPWPSGDRPRRAGVSSFGISGTNAHVVVEEAPAPAFRRENTQVDKLHLVALTAKSEEALKQLAGRWLDMLSHSEEHLPSLHDLAYTAALHRTHHEHRLAVVAASPRDLATSLQSVAGEDLLGTAVVGQVQHDMKKVVFVFPGQGSQWLGMGRQLMVEPAFRDAIEQCDRAIRQFVEWSVIEQLRASDTDSRLHEIGVVQPMLFAVEVALAALWRRWGIEPDAVVGHSMGEVAAAYVAGALTLEDAARVICLRSRLLQRISGQGAMAVVDLSIDEAAQEIRGYEDRVSIAVSNSPTSTVLSGQPQALDEILAGLTARGIFCRSVKVDVASHSPQVDVLQEDLLALLAPVRPQVARVPIYSTVTASATDGSGFTAQYWSSNLRSPVLFSSVVEQLLENGHGVFMEMSPNPLLLGAVQQVARRTQRESVTLASTRRDENERSVMLTSLAELFVAGYSVRWDAQFLEGGRTVSLPSCPWEREPYWIDRHHVTRIASDVLPPTAHPLLGRRVYSATQPSGYLWETVLSSVSPGYLRDHQIAGTPALAAMAFLEIARAASSEAFGDGTVEIEGYTIDRALFLNQEQHVILQTALTPDTCNAGTVQWFSRVGGSDDEWTLHAHARIRLIPAPDSLGASRAEDLPDDPHSVEASAHYEFTACRGVSYGPSFQTVQCLVRSEREIVGQVRSIEQPASHGIHPALLDGFLQILYHLVLQSSDHWGGTYVPVQLRRTRLHHALLEGALDGMYTVYATSTPPEDDGTAIVGNWVAVAPDGTVVAEVEGAVFQRLEGDSDIQGQDIANWLYQMQWKEQPWPKQERDITGEWLILADDLGIADTITSELRDRGARTVEVRAREEYRALTGDRYEIDPADVDEFSRLLNEAFDEPPAGIVHLWSATVPSGTESDYLTEAQRLGTVATIHLVQAINASGWSSRPELWLVTRGSQIVAVEDAEEAAPTQAPLFGLGRVLVNEHPELRCKRLDLDPRRGIAAGLDLVQALATSDDEDEVALRSNRRYVRRLSPYALHDAPSRITRIASTDEPFRLSSTEPGVLDHLMLESLPRRAPAANEVEIRVKAVGLNFRDVMSAMGMLSGYPSGQGPFGYECSGIVVTVGGKVEEFRPGDEVMAIGKDSFASYVTSHESLVVHKPAHLSFEEAATIPITYVTAAYALERLGHMEAGERVLIHAAAGGVGFAAVQLAQEAGAEVFATAGNPEKREFLRSRGVQHVFDSRTLDFSRQVKDETGGEGVDIVLNSLAGAFIPASLDVLRPYGRFIEIGRRDIYENRMLGLAPFQRNLSFMAIDLDHMIRERPYVVRALLRDVVRRSEEGALPALPHTVFRISDVTDAFRTMAQARHIGKIVVAFNEPEVAVSVPPLEALSPDATYLITGGYGGLGLELAGWMIDHGARHLCLVGRHGPPEWAVPVLNDLRSRGAQIYVLLGDISRREEVARVLEEIRETMPPLRGVIHAAAVLDDAIVLNQDKARFDRVAGAKAYGALHLHALTINDNLDFFVVFSSSAAIIGSPGQSNYVAANELLDALTQLRCARGLPGLSINWGPWSEVGLAARPDRAGRLAERGMASITPAQGITAFERVLHRAVAQVAVMPADWLRWHEFYPSYSEKPLLSELVHVAPSPANASSQETSDRAMLMTVAPLQRLDLLESIISEQITTVMGLSRSRIDPHQGLIKLGLDSLMAVELRNWLELNFHTSIPVTRFLQGLSVRQLAAEVSEAMSSSEIGSARAPDTSGVSHERDELDMVADLSDDEVEALLQHMLSGDEVTE